VLRLWSARAEPILADLDAPPGRIGDLDGPVASDERGLEQPLLPRVELGRLDRELDVGPGVLDRTQEVQREHGDERQVGGVRRAGQPRASRQLRHLQRPGQAAEVADVRLDDVDRAHVDDPSPLGEQAVLLPAGDVELERIRHLARPVELPVRARLLEVADAVVLEHPADLDRLRRRVAAVRVDEQGDVVAERTAGTIASVRPGHSS
jgi:hypothetical protein